MSHIQSPVPSQSQPPRAPLRQRLTQLLAEYGQVALWTYFGIFAVVLLAFAAAIKLGFHTESTAATAGVWGAAYVATKLTQPLRIAGALALTPLIMKVARRLKRTSTGS